ncbi:circularly permutated Ras protein 1-like [Ostrea edulis]|uniref:circularly permutated Ras protein 1-like n=1 Tax=Ostrea edulis TaxID=37623 RepID=UPI002094A550|nr:circularly permutated Ras protein 1-like [Ostrea edulis]XP_048768215.1 circularly permutated Ras protein 1-like [Ostrea edulis]XP_048768216.1 circularly permutated Ras protein 1-like [Ostrea edulis]
MNFGSDKVFLYNQPEFEVVSEEEYEHGMSVSDSSSGEENEEEVTRSSSLPSGSGPSSPKSQKPGFLAGLFGAKSTKPATPPEAKSKRAKFRRKKVGKWRDIEQCYDVGPQNQQQQQHQPQQQRAPQEQGKRHRRADTNIISIDFKKIIAPSNMHTGDPVHCTSCDVILSSLSKITTREDQKMWHCEFCGTDNELDVEEEEIPRNNDVTYMLEPGLSTASSGLSGKDESLVIFCVDTSGSMCVTSTVPGRINLRGSVARLQSLNTDRSDQHMPRERRDVTYISRLQAVQAAMDHQLEEMIKQHPNRRVALITFNNEVTIIGDGSETPMTIAGDKLTSADDLREKGKEIQMPGAIHGSRGTLGAKLFGLEEGGATALGPALLMATTMAGQHPGSKVIICTDGKANVGLGRLDVEGEEMDRESQFYEGIGKEAADQGVAVSVISIKGTDCKMVHLGKIADMTGGQVNIVDPLKLTQEFSTILADQIIATNVVATCHLHKRLFFYYEATEDSKVVRNIGNVTASTEVTFEYGVRCQTDQGQRKTPTVNEKTEMGNEASGGEKDTQAASGSREQPMETDQDDLKELPFQLVVKYTDTEGATALRVVTQSRPITYDRREAEKNMNLKVLGAHTAQTTSALALGGEYTESRGRALMNQRLAWRFTNVSSEGQRQKKAYKKMFGKIKSMDHYINSRQQEERKSYGRTYSESESDDSDDELDVERAHSSKTPSKEARGKAKAKLFTKSTKLKKRSATCSDTGANLMFQMKQGSRYLDNDSDENK